MKVIRIHAGTAAVRVATDEIYPPSDPPLLDLISTIQQRYQFLITPVIDAAQLNGPFEFKAGKFVNSEIPNSISQMVLQLEGGFVTTSSTDLAELILDDLHGLLDKTFHFRLTSATQKRSYASAIIVEFESSIEKQIEFIGRVGKLVNSSEGKFPERKFKRISFGLEDQNIPNPAKPMMISPLEAIEKVEFFIERRAGEPFSLNRYFCVAPIRTKHHIQVLEQINEILKARSKK
jgi:hypothetical protein